MPDLNQLAAILSDQGGDKPLPVEQWNPTHCGAMDMVIRADGTWWHEGSMITRAPLVRLFSRILRRDDDGYVLVTPVEKITITVEDVPFLAVDFDRTDEGYQFRTNVGDHVTVSDEHPLTFRHSAMLDQKAPYVLVRGGLEARVDRAAYYRLAEELPLDERRNALRLESGGAVFFMEIGDGDAG